jgi:hypothetical protein
VLIPFFKKADVPLFNKPQSRAFEVTQTIRPAAHIPTIRRARQNPWDE